MLAIETKFVMYTAIILLTLALLGSVVLNFVQNAQNRRLSFRLRSASHIHVETEAAPDESARTINKRLVSKIGYAVLKAKEITTNISTEVEDGTHAELDFDIL